MRKLQGQSLPSSYLNKMYITVYTFLWNEYLKFCVLQLGPFFVSNAFSYNHHHLPINMYKKKIKIYKNIVPF